MWFTWLLFFASLMPMRDPTLTAVSTGQQNPQAEAFWRKQIWEEWKVRHGVFWKSLYRWGMAIVTVSVIPYVKTDIFIILGPTVLIFPCTAFLLSCAAAWHLGAEYLRLTSVTRKLKEMRGIYNPPAIGNSWYERVLGASIGRVVLGVFTVGFWVLSYLNYRQMLQVLERLHTAK